MSFRVLIAYIVILHVGPILNMIGMLPGARVYPITAFAHALMVALATRRFVRPQFGRATSTLDWLVIAFVFWSAASIVLYFQPGNPSDVMAYFYGVQNYLLPVFGYFAIKTVSSDDQWRVLRFALWAYVFMFAVGLVLWTWRPEFYTVHLREVMLNADSEFEEWKVYSRLQSYSGSTTVGISAAIAIILAAVLPMNFAIRSAILALALICAILSYQRGGIAATAIAAGFFFIAPGSSRTFRVIGGGVFAAGAAIVFAVLAANAEGGLDYYLSRRNDFNNMLAGRQGYPLGLEYLSAFPLGVGLGGSGGAAFTAGLLSWGKVVDANFMRIAADLGIQGVLLFIAILIAAFYSSIRVRRVSGLSMLIVIYILVAIGTNVFDGHITPHLFWILLGVADTAEDAEQPVTVTEELEQPATELDLPAPAHARAQT